MNRLIKEKSPYLIQHAQNPIDWYPWCNDAFIDASIRDVPIFLSIGYSTCHWCHVMEKESFIDTDVAEILNNHFVAIKVDREERPDVDKLYMNFCHILTSTGGWPLTILMTPSKKPFYAGTYLPKHSNHRTTGLMDLLTKTLYLWNNKRQEIISISQKITEHLERFYNQTSIDNTHIDYRELCNNAFNALKTHYDSKNGGFGLKPKFPMPLYIQFLMQFYKKNKDKDIIQMIQNTLTSMRLGGIYDQIGDGYHRYCVDEHWQIPHFEKMLYDQAMLIDTYTEAFTITKDDLYRETAHDVIGYVLKDLTSNNAVFYTAEDADSDGEEGLFYLWDKEEINTILGNDDADSFFDIFSLTSPLEDEKGSVLYVRKENKNLFVKKTKTPEFKAIMNKLLNFRKTNRTKPLRDEKVLTDINGLMINSLLKAGVEFQRDRYIRHAIKSIEYILSNGYSQKYGLFHRYIDGQWDIQGFLSDYAYLIYAMIQLHKITGEKRYFDAILELTHYTIGHFIDKKNSGFFYSSDKQDDIPIRIKELSDDVIPSANSIMMANLLDIYETTKDNTYRDIAISIPNADFNTIKSSPVSCCSLLTVLLKHL